MRTAADDPSPQVIDAIGERTRRITETLRRLGEDELERPSELPDWSRLTIACHLRFGADALMRMTDATLRGDPTAYYPEGRETQRPQTLVPLPGESPAAVIESLAELGHNLHQSWSALDAGAWRVQVAEPVGNPDLGPVPLGRLPLLRLTEVEVHGTDLGLGLPDWSGRFVSAALPLRLEWLNTRRVNHRAFDAALHGSWLLVATDGPTYHVRVRGLEVESEPASPGTPATAVIEAGSRDLLALLLGRPLRTPPVLAGDVDFARAFPRAFPGPSTRTRSPTLVTAPPPRRPGRYPVPVTTKGSGQMSTLSNDAKQDLLSRIGFFGGCTEAELRDVAQLAEERRIPIGKDLCVQGAFENDVYLVVEGEADVIIEGAAVGRTKIGEIVGELAMLGSGTRAATFRARTELVVLVLDPREIDSVLAADPSSAPKLSQHGSGAGADS